MQIIREIENYRSDGKPLYLALGNFDGLHRGHQKLMQDVVTMAESNCGVAAALIFDPHPMKVLYPEKELKLLVTPEMKAELLEGLGLDLLIYHTFSTTIARLSPEEFVSDILVEQLAVKAVFVGFNYSFGFKGAGTPEMLAGFGKKYGFTTHVISPVKYQGEVISSTVIRQSIESGDIELAGQLLGYLPMVEGLVIEGEKRGRQIGFPTANLGVDPDLVIPRKGVYAAWARIGDKTVKAVVNIGSKPTFHPDFPVVIEAHLLDYNEDLYGKCLRLYFTTKLRNEHKFNSVEALVEQIRMDRDQAALSLKSFDEHFHAFTF